MASQMSAMSDEQLLEELYNLVNEAEALVDPARAVKPTATLAERVAAWEGQAGSASTGERDRTPPVREPAETSERASHSRTTEDTAEREHVPGGRVPAGHVPPGHVPPGPVPGEPEPVDPFGRWRDVDRELRAQRLEELGAEVGVCMKCPLAPTRTHAVPGEGVLDPLVMVVGEGPGKEEDRTGRPFVGRAGRYLDTWLASIGLDRTRNAYIANLVKCRPPENRDPVPEEIAACLPYLEEQIALVQPRLILCAGRIAMRTLTESDAGVTRIHGTFFSWRGLPVVPTFHPSAVLRNEAWKRPVWEDLKQVRNWLVDHAGHQPDGRG